MLASIVRPSFRLAIAATLTCLLMAPWATPAQAADLQITALVAAKPEHFQINLTSNTTSSTITSGQIITFTLTYGSYLPTSTDSVALIVNWQQTPLNPNILHYIENSALPAIQGAQPQVNLAQQTITWYISPMPPGLNHRVTWQLAHDPQGVARQNIDLAITASLTGPGVQIIPQPLRFTLIPSPITPIPSLASTPQPSQHLSQPQPGTSVVQPTNLPTGMPTPTHIQPTSNPIWSSATIGPVGWLSLLIALTLLSMIIWLIKRHFLLILWLFYRRQTLLYGQVLFNNQAIQVNILVTSVKQHQLTAQTYTTTSNSAGQYQIKLAAPGTYVLHITGLHAPSTLLHQQSLIIGSHQRGQRILLSFELKSKNDTIDTI